MTTVVIACETIREEYEMAAKQAGCNHKTIWMESGLHNSPPKLHGRLQEELCKVSADRVLLAFGDCGNSVVGIKTGNFELIKPRVDDCVTLFIGSVKTRVEISGESGSYFLTQGWLDNSENIYNTYKFTLEQYGEELGLELMGMMIGNYKRLVLLDTGGENIASAAAETERMASEMGFGWKVIPARLEYLRDLLTGPWDEERFYIVPPNSVIEARPYY